MAGLIDPSVCVSGDDVGIVSVFAGQFDADVNEPIYEFKLADAFEFMDQDELAPWADCLEALAAELRGRMRAVK